MKKLVKLLATSWVIVAFLIASTVKAETIAIVQDEVDIVLELPADACDISERAAGKRILEFLEQQLSKMSVAPTPKRIINQCQNPDYEPYPWGYVAAMPSPKYITNQAQLNSKTEKDMGSSAYNQQVKEIIADAKEAGDPAEALKEGYGIDVSEMQFGVPQLLSIDDHALHMLMKNQYQVNGVLLKETVYISVMHVKGKIVYWYLYDNGETGFNPIDWLEKVNAAGALTER